MSIRRTIVGLIRLQRPGRILMAVFAVAIGGLVGKASLEIDLKLILAMISTALVMAGGNAINDFYDFEVDKINKPDRPLPSGQVSLRTTKYYSIGLFGSGIIIAIMFLPY